MTGRIWRIMVVLHRYAGVAVSLLMAMWFLSGMVMMYVPYAPLPPPESLPPPPPIPFASCCDYGPLADDAAILLAQLSERAGAPLVRLRTPGQRDVLFDLARGEQVRVDAEGARAVALEAAARAAGRPAAVTGYAVVPFDQFTLGWAPRERPFHRFTFDDPDRTAVYVSAVTGGIAAWTTATYRTWNWLGTIPHFLYFEPLRVQQQLWNGSVVWTALLGTFLTAIGIVLGVAQLRRGKGARLSPYRGWFYWHHVTGLVFGVLALTFVFSGLVSMNPFGFLEGGGGGEAGLALGTAPRLKEVKDSLQVLRTELAGSGVVSLVSAPLDGRLYWMADFAQGPRQRLDAAGRAAPLTLDDLAQAARRVAGERAIREQGLMREEDAYYYAPRRGRSPGMAMPVYRLVVDDEEQTRYYLDAETGAPVLALDAAGRWQRWLFTGLHRLDFTAPMRAAPVRDIVMWLALLGGFALSATGVWLAVCRVRTDLAALRASLRRLAKAWAGGRPAGP